MNAVLTSTRLVLRPPRLADAAAIFAALEASRAELLPWMSWYRAEYGLADARTWIEQCRADWTAGHAFGFLAFDRGDQHLVGSCSLHHVEQVHRRGSLGYWMHTPDTGRGLATEAARLVVRFGIREVGLERIEIVAAVGNRASQRVAERMGATREGVLRGRLTVHNTQHDAVCYSLLSSDVAAWPDEWSHSEMAG